MKTELLKELLGSKINQATQENFELGYDPILEIVDDYELGFFEPSDTEKSCEEEWEETEEYLFRMSFLKPTDEDYSTIYAIFCCGNGWYYSKEEDDIFLETMHGKHLWCDRNQKWYYYYLDRRIIEKLKETPTMDHLIPMLSEKFVPTSEKDVDINALINEIISTSNLLFLD